MGGRPTIPRPAFFLLLVIHSIAAAGQNQAASEQAVRESYKRMEQADRQGDGQLWFTLRDRKTLDSMDARVREAILKGGRRRPAVKYEAIAVRVRGAQAVLTGKVTDSEGGTVQYGAILFALEDQQWKIAREQWGDAPFDPFLLSAWLLPENGSFLRAGAPWKDVPYAAPNPEALGKQEMPWKIQATMDQSFLYLRFEANAPLPLPGAKLGPQTGRTGSTGGLPPPPPMRIKVLPAGDTPTDPEYVVAVSDLVTTHGGFESQEGDRYSVAYSLFVRNAAGDDIFQSSIGDGTASPMLAVEGRFIDAKLPLTGLGVDGFGVPKIELVEADSALRLLPYKVEPFAGQ